MVWQDATLRGAKDDPNTKQNKYLTEESKTPYGRLQPTAINAYNNYQQKEETTTQLKNKTKQKRNPKRMLAPNITVNARK